MFLEFLAPALKKDLYDVAVAITWKALATIQGAEFHLSNVAKCWGEKDMIYLKPKVDTTSNEDTWQTILMNNPKFNGNDSCEKVAVGDDHNKDKINIGRCINCYGPALTRYLLINWNKKHSTKLLQEILDFEEGFRSRLSTIKINHWQPENVEEIPEEQKMNRKKKKKRKKGKVSRR